MFTRRGQTHVLESHLGGQEKDLYYETREERLENGVLKGKSDEP